MSKQNILVLPSTVPLPDKVAGIKKIYIIWVLFLVVGVKINLLLVIGILGFLAWASFDYWLTGFQLDKLEQVKFKFLPGISGDDIYSRMQPVLISKYNNNVRIEMGHAGEVSFSYDGCDYILKISNDATFSLHGYSTSWFVFRRYKLYKKMLAGMALVGFELQKAYDIK